MSLPRVQGSVVFFTGLPGAGKSTLACALAAELSNLSGRRANILDGDVVRRHISADLHFSKEDRDLNVSRIGIIAAEIAKRGGIVICAVVAPYDETRKRVRALIERGGSGFLLVHMATPLAVCEQRDSKGLYARARAGDIPQFTGVSDPYETPSDAELVIDTTHITVEDAARLIVEWLGRKDYLAPLHSASLCPHAEFRNTAHLDAGSQ